MAEAGVPCNSVLPSTLCTHLPPQPFGPDNLVHTIPAGPFSPGDALPPGWYKLIQPQGDVYYRHEETHIVTKQHPATFDLKGIYPSLLQECRGNSLILDERHEIIIRLVASPQGDRSIDYYVVDYADEAILLWFGQRPMRLSASRNSTEYWTHLASFSHRPIPQSRVDEVFQILMWSSDIFGRGESKTLRKVVQGFLNPREQVYTAYRTNSIAKIMLIIERHRSVGGAFVPPVATDCVVAIPRIVGEIKRRTLEEFLRGAFHIRNVMVIFLPLWVLLLGRVLSLIHDALRVHSHVLYAFFFGAWIFSEYILADLRRYTAHFGIDILRASMFVTMGCLGVVMLYVIVVAGGPTNIVAPGSNVLTMLFFTVLVGTATFMRVRFTGRLDGAQG
ncbi:hypothetical protein FRB99_007506 [Tulasnella sp. 403]|nr:hypothetical protein FRB99_007506 [Tulasnella sp. 403]